MAYDKEMVAMRLELIASKAKQLASDVRNGQLWEGELRTGLGEINEQSQRLQQSARNDR